MEREVSIHLFFGHTRLKEQTKTHPLDKRANVHTHTGIERGIEQSQSRVEETNRLIEAERLKKQMK